jgi:serine/threonine-protein kinase
MADSDASVIVLAEDPLVGQSIGAYVVKSALGAGGMAQVYFAEHQAIGRKMAVKVLRAEVAAQSEWHQRFIAEAQAIAALKHRNIVEVFDFGQLPDGRQFIMMEYVEGDPLDTYITQHAPLPPAVALDFADQILNALGEAHKKGIVHRDLKPGNVMLVREHNNETLLKVLDFGLARQEALVLAAEPGQDSAKSSLVAGTPAYVAPEQALGEIVDGRADLYALGVMLFEMLAGKLPFEAADDRGFVEMHVSSPPPPLERFATNLPDGLSRLVASLLAKSRDERPASADVARQSVQRIVKQLRADATAVRPMPVPRPQPQHHVPTEKIERAASPAQGPSTDLSLAAVRPSPWPKRVGAVAGVGVLLALVFFLWPRGSADVPPAPPPVEPPKVELAGGPPPPPTPEVPPEEDPVAPLADPPQKTAAMPVRPVVGRPRSVPVVEAPACEPSDRWRKGALAQLADLGNLASKKSVQVGVWFDGEEQKLSEQLRAASTPGECAAVETALARLQRDIEKK